ncbi:MAG: pseudouridine synthase [Pleomorphochaeta sp.]
MEYNIIDNIVYEDDNLLVVNKLSNMPTVPLKKGPTRFTLLDAISLYCPAVKSFDGYNSYEGGVLHRLDTPTSGLVLVAKNKKSFDFLYEEQKKNNFEKKYLVKASKRGILLDGFYQFPYKDYEKENPVIVKSFFRHYGKGHKSVRPVLPDYSKKILDKTNKKYYETSVSFLKKDDEGIYYFLCSLTNGFRHQIRAHLAWGGYPLLGDVLYGGKESDEFGLNCVSIQFTNPETKKIQIVNLKDDNS